MRAGCRSLNSVSAWRSLPFPNRFCMRFYCPIEANHGAGPQKTVDNFMTINSIWSREGLIITQGCAAKIFSPRAFRLGRQFRASFKGPPGPLGTSESPLPHSLGRMCGTMERPQGAQHSSSPYSSGTSQVPGTFNTFQCPSL